MCWLLLVAFTAFAQVPPDATFGPELPPAAQVEAPLPRPSEDELFQRLLAPEPDGGVPSASNDSRRAGGLSVAWALGIAVLGAAGFLVWRRREGSGDSLAPTIRVIAQLPLSSQSGLALVEIGERTLLVGTGSQPPSILADLSEPAPERVPVRRAASRATAQTAESPRAELPVETPVRTRADFERKLSAAQELVDEMLRQRTG